MILNFEKFEALHTHCEETYLFLKTFHSVSGMNKKRYQADTICYNSKTKNKHLEVKISFFAAQCLDILF